MRVLDIARTIKNILPLPIQNLIDDIRGKYYSCHNIREGFNFYRSNKVSSCCYSSDSLLVIGNIEDPDIITKIEERQNALIKLHKSNKAPACCKTCVNFEKKKWTSTTNKKWSWIPLNHYKACNLKCVHCGYIKTDDKEKDTSHELVKQVIDALYKADRLSPNCTIAIGGGEPSINTGIDDILNYCLSKNLNTLINSNGAKYSETISLGVNNGLFRLDLTPDAGSKEVYEKIKGVDFFETTWNNIKKYMETTNGKANVKFIIEEGNKDDIENMIAMCKKSGANHCTLAFDLNIKETDFEKYREPVNKFIRLCKENGIECAVSSFVPKTIINREKF